MLSKSSRIQQEIELLQKEALGRREMTKVHLQDKLSPYYDAPRHMLKIAKMSIMLDAKETESLLIALNFKQLQLNPSAIPSIEAEANKQLITKLIAHKDNIA